jgi:hypothetical protein
MAPFSENKNRAVEQQNARVDGIAALLTKFKIQSSIPALTLGIYIGDGSLTWRNIMLRPCKYCFVSLAAPLFVIGVANGDTNASPAVTTNPTVTATNRPSTQPSDVTGVARSTALIKLSWKAVNGNVYYLVFRGESADFQLGESSQISPGISETSFADDRGLTAGKTYYYKIIAVQSSPPFPAKEVGSVTVSTPDHDEPLAPLKPGEDD